MGCCGLVGRRLPAIFVVIIVGLVAIGHTHVTLNHGYYAPQVLKPPSRGVPAVFSEPQAPTTADYYNVAIFWCIVLLIYYCQYKIMFTNAGHVNHEVIDVLASLPAQPQQGQPTVLRVACFETKGNGCRRYCRKCRQWKPDRTHHCYDCGQCTLRLDHHCGFLNNCIGFHNHKYFVLFLFYSAMGASYASLSLLRLEPMNMFRRAPQQIFKMEVMSLLVISAAFAIVLIGFFVIHTLIISAGYTTIEFMEKNDSLKNGKSYVNPYHISRMSSLRGIMGKSMMKWLLPFSPPSSSRDKSAGHMFPVNRRHHQQPYPA